jgi:hypothetical protein
MTRVTAHEVADSGPFHNIPCHLTGRREQPRRWSRQRGDRIVEFYVRQHRRLASAPLYS